MSVVFNSAKLFQSQMARKKIISAIFFLENVKFVKTVLARMLK